MVDNKHDIQEISSVRTNAIFLHLNFYEEEQYSERGMGKIEISLNLCFHQYLLIQHLLS